MPFWLLSGGGGLAGHDPGKNKIHVFIYMISKTSLIFTLNTPFK